MSIKDLVISLGDNKELRIEADKETVRFDVNRIVNNDDGWLDGFEYTWTELFELAERDMKKHDKRLDVHK